LKVVVTGGAGFIGSHLAKKLIQNGDSVTVVDDFSTGTEENLRDLDVQPRVVRGDLREQKFARDFLKGADCVYHFAAEVGSVQYLHGSEERELFALQVNLQIDTNVLRACVENKVKTIIYASSVSVYPKHLQMVSSAPFREEDAEKQVEPEGGYGWSKYIAEKELDMMSGTNVGVARIFHAYGKNIYLNEDKSQVMGSLMRKAIHYPRENFVVWGDGNQKRCFVYIDDVMDALGLIYEYVSKNRKLTVNVGSQDEITVGDLARKIIALSGKEIPLNYDRSKPTGVLQRIPSLEKIYRTLGWKPETTMDEGLKTTFEWVKGRLA
jgi:GDP-D-mannose 3', 5'-epimerase